MDKMEIDKDGTDFIKAYEKFIPHVYDDADRKHREWDGKSKPKGILTIGYGHTNKGADALKIKAGLKLTKEQALQVLKNDIAGAEKIVKSSGIKVKLTQRQYNVLVSRAMNYGKVGGNLVKALNKGDAKAIAAALEKPNTSKGKPSRGLKDRRAAEKLSLIHI